MLLEICHEKLCLRLACSVQYIILMFCFIAMLSNPPQLPLCSFYPQNTDKEKENGPLVGYKISYACVKTAVTRECSSTALSTQLVTGNGKRELNLGSLSSWTRYSVKVKVYNKIGDGPYSAIVNFTTLEERKFIYTSISVHWLDMYLIKKMVQIYFFVPSFH